MLLTKERENMQRDATLYHHGILGQKWGVRRYQNEDGSLTTAGRKRRGENLNKIDYQIKDRKQASKNRRGLSDAELNKRIERLQTERRLKDLTDEDIAPGRTAVKQILTSSGKKVASTVITGAALYAIKAGLEGKFNAKEAAGYLAPKPKNK